MTRADGESIGIGEVNMPDRSPGLEDRFDHIGFLDVHVEPVCEQFGTGEPTDQFGSLGQRIALVSLVAIQGFVEDLTPDRFGLGVESLEPLSQELLGLILAHPRSRSSLHRADDHRSPQLRGHDEHGG